MTLARRKSDRRPQGQWRNYDYNRPDPQYGNYDPGRYYYEAPRQRVDPAATVEIDLSAHRLRIGSGRDAQAFRAALTEEWGIPAAYVGCGGSIPKNVVSTHLPRMTGDVRAA